MLVVAGAMTAASVAQADVTFSFADPAGASGQLMNMPGLGAGGTGLLMYDTNANLTFIVDGTSSGLGATSFTAHMEMNMNLGAATTAGGVTIAPVTGSYTIFTGSGGSRVNLLTGNATSGAFVRVGSTNSMLMSNPGFSYSAGPGLAGFLGANTLTGSQESVFTVTNLNFQGALIGANGQFSAFTGNTSYSGNSGLVPSPGALALLMAGGTLALRRRRN
jgi:MYXO-CTERM domain-containing protein